MKKIIIIFALCIFSVTALAQKAKIKNANNEYGNLGYMDAVKVYERVALKGNGTSEVYEKLANSYYFNGDYQNASKWFSELFSINENEEAINPEVYYRYSQCLKSIGDFEQSNLYFDKFSKVMPNDSRSLYFKENRNYFKEIEDISGRYNIEITSINSKMSDFGASFYQDKLVFASSKSKDAIHNWTEQPFTDLYFAKMDSLGNLSSVTSFDKKINSKLNESTAVFTKDGITMYFTRNNIIGNKPDKNSEDEVVLKIYKATKNDKAQKWDNIEELPFNSDAFNTAHPTLSPNEDYLYFASNRPGGFGESDLYKVKINGDSFGEPENLGKIINTAAKETFPYISSNNELFFASSGHLGLGGLDVFAVKIKGSSEYSKVFNVGKPINSEFDDFSYIINYDKNFGFFTSNRTSGEGYDDIYKFVETEKLPFDCSNILKGNIKDSYFKDNIVDVEIVLFDIDGNIIKTIKSDSNGNYVFYGLDCKTTYVLRLRKDDYDTIEEYIVTTDRNSNEIIKDFKITKNKIPIEENIDLAKIYGIQNIYFDLDKWNITKRAEEKLNILLAVMEEYPNLKVDIRSHTDCRQTETYNQRLSDRRAKSTINWLVKKGINTNRLTGKGYGELQLVNDCECEPTSESNCSETEHQENRRSEFIIM